MVLSNTIKSIQDIMRKDVGVDGDAQRIGQLVWMLFLKIFDDREDDLDPFVVVETLTAELTVTELNDVAVYQEAFARLRHVALFDAEAEALLSQIMRAPGAS